MTVDEIVDELRPLGAESYKKVIANHGVREPFFGVKIESLKKIQKRIKMDYALALGLYDTGIFDAMYLAGLIADDANMTPKDLNRWVAKAYCPMLSDYTVAWVAAGSPQATEIASEWIDSKKEMIAGAGWSTFGGLASMTPDDDLDLPAYKKLVQRVGKTIANEPDRARQSMNRFLIAIGSYVPALTELAVKTATAIGPLVADMGDTACKLPYAPENIAKATARGTLGKKKKTVKC